MLDPASVKYIRKEAAEWKEPVSFDRCVLKHFDGC